MQAVADETLGKADQVQGKLHLTLLVHMVGSLHVHHELEPFVKLDPDRIEILVDHRHHPCRGLLPEDGLRYSIPGGAGIPPRLGQVLPPRGEVIAVVPAFRNRLRIPERLPVPGPQGLGEGVHLLPLIVQVVLADAVPSKLGVQLGDDVAPLPGAGARRSVGRWGSRR